MTEQAAADVRTYTNGRDIQDADTHIFEGPDFYRPFLDPDIRERVRPLYTNACGFTEADYRAAEERHRDPDFRVESEALLMRRKLFDALGAFDRQDRSRALDLLGFRRQIIFETFLRLLAREYEDEGDVEMVYGLAKAHVRAMVDFSSGDDRLITAGYVPLVDIPRAVQQMRFAIDSGCRAISMNVECPRTHSPAHKDLEPMWAMAAEARVPIMLHLGGGRNISDAYAVTGRRTDHGYVGGDGTFTSLQFLGTPLPLIEMLNALIVDGVLHRHPALRFGILEYGASWVPGWLHFLDTAVVAYRRIEERLQQLDLSLSNYARRQLRFSPFHFENIGWAMREAPADMFLFSWDYTHMEGGRDPVAKIDVNLDAHDISAADRHRFYSANFDDLVGSA